MPEPKTPIIEARERLLAWLLVIASVVLLFLQAI